MLDCALEENEYQCLEKEYDEIILRIPLIMSRLDAILVRMREIVKE